MPRRVVLIANACSGAAELIVKPRLRFVMHGLGCTNFRVSFAVLRAPFQAFARPDFGKQFRSSKTPAATSLK